MNWKLIFTLLGVALMWLVGIYFVISLSGCTVVKYGGIEYTRCMNQEIGLLVLTETVDPNGISDVRVVIVGQKANHDEMMAEFIKGLAAGILAVP